MSAARSIYSMLRSKDVIAFLKQQGPKSTTEIAEALGVFPWDACGACCKLAKQGKVRRIGRTPRGEFASAMIWEASDETG